MGRLNLNGMSVEQREAIIQPLKTGYNAIMDLKELRMQTEKLIQNTFSPRFQNNNKEGNHFTFEKPSPGQFNLLVEDFSDNKVCKMNSDQSHMSNKRIKMSDSVTPYHHTSIESYESSPQNQFTLIDNNNFNGQPTKTLLTNIIIPQNENASRLRSISYCGNANGLSIKKLHIRGEMKKCRAVYGVENKVLWCKACIWKKRCTKFPG